MFDRAVLHLDVDDFFTSVECLRNSALKGRPLIVSSNGERGVVADCSPEARAFGVHPAMPMRLARLRCPEAVVIRGDMEAYHRYSELVTHVVEDEAPLFEKSAIGSFYIDLTGMDRHIGCWRWSRELSGKIGRETGLPLSLGLAVNKLVSRVGATEAGPGGARLVEAGAEKRFLAPLPVRRLPAVEPAVWKKLSLMGVRTVETLSRIPPELLRREFGPPGAELWKKANALDESPVVPYRQSRSLAAEHTFAIDTIDLRQLHGALSELISRLASELRRRRQLASCLSVKLRYTDFNTFSRRRRIDYTAADGVLRRQARELFDELYQRRQSVRLIGVQLGRLVHGHPQLDLFAPQDDHEDALLRAMDRLRRRFGEKAVRWGDAG